MTIDFPALLKGYQMERKVGEGLHRLPAINWSFNHNSTSQMASRPITTRPTSAKANRVLLYELLPRPITAHPIRVGLNDLSANNNSASHSLSYQTQPINHEP